MKFQFTPAFTFLLLSASASSFGANSPKRIHRGSSSSPSPSSSSSSSSVSRIPFISGGATTSTFGTRLKSSVDSTATTSSAVPAAVTSENLELLSERGRKVILSLIEHDVDGFQKHVYGDWPESGIEDEGKKLLAEQVSLVWLFCVNDDASHHLGRKNNIIDYRASRSLLIIFI